jgi:hypothetical protein
VRFKRASWCTGNLINIEQRIRNLKPKLAPSPTCFIEGITGDRECCAPAYQREASIMQKPYFLPDHINVPIQRPACPRCQTRMMLARIMPARVGFDLRTFECPQCDHVHEVMVATEAFGRSFTPPA